MTKQEILFALDITHPGGAPIKPGAAWETRDDLLKYWEGKDDVPSIERLQEALEEHYLAESSIELRATARAMLRAKLDSLPAWIRGPFQDKFATANTLLDSGQDDAAAALIQFSEVPTGYTVEQAGVFAMVRADLLAAISSLPE